ncbi:hypothetical protein GCM10010358_38710 [Streptomyces minutiscleroticus]|uniref:phospholipase D n=1 Tax=Streptomyces minutiscleroticus TaxID=68238 RepID=A0A918U155_9ACTN|nr:phospholipase D-like domain-containing protein [Streptomyces minutiscleroticus]GGX80742.1 hypothetical protein GCM10010358_38710 [Streptomyces minutiscleroticus]
MSGALHRLVRPVALAATTLLLAFAGLLGGTAPPAWAATNRTGWVFNQPDGAVEEQQAIRLRILGLIADAAPGSDIKVTVYQFWDAEVARALVAAHTERQVDVQVMLDEGSVSSRPESTTYSILATALGTDRSRPSFAGMCPVGKSCLGDPALGDSINHNKFWLFSDTGGVKDVVVQTSSNFTTASWTKMYNDAYVAADPVLHASYSAYFAKLAGMDWDSWTYTTQPTSGPYKPYFFPRAGTTASTDTVVGILDNITGCTYTDADGVRRTTEIRLGMFLFTRTAVATKLAALRSQGCGVSIVYSSAGATVWKTLHYSGGPAVRCENHEDDTDPTNSRRLIHSKFLLIEGAYLSKPDKLVWTGSHNYSNPALRRNDEALLKIDDDAVHDAYAARFADIFGAARPGIADDTPECRGSVATREQGTLAAP